MSLQATRRCVQKPVCSVCSLCSLLFQRQLGCSGAPRTARQWRQPVPARGITTFDRQLGVRTSATTPGLYCAPKHPAPVRARLQAPAAMAAAAPPTAERAAAESEPKQQDQQQAQAISANEAYEQQLAGKIDHVRTLFSDFQLPELEIFRSDPDHYRLRAEFRIWHQGDDVYYIMFEKVEGEKRPKQVRVDEFKRGSVLMNELMQLLIDKVKQVPVLRMKLYQANFHTTLSGQAMVTLVYHRPVDAAWESAAKELRTYLAQAPSCSAEEVTVIGRSRKRKLELDCSYVSEALVVAGQEYTSRQVEGAFSQPNGKMCQHMLAWAQGVTAGSNAADLLELYCGNANFTIPLAQNFRQVVATEVSKASVETAQHNLKSNSVSNVLVARMSSEEFTAAWHEKRACRRLPGLDWSALDLKTILVDPPRAGLDSETVQLLQGFPTVVYISCNPATLVENLREIKDTHDIEEFAIFDQFPGTEHLECGVFLQRRSGSTEQPSAAPAQAKEAAAPATAAQAEAAINGDIAQGEITAASAITQPASMHDSAANGSERNK